MVFGTASPDRTTPHILSPRLKTTEVIFGQETSPFGLAIHKIGS